MKRTDKAAIGGKTEVVTCTATRDRVVIVGTSVLGAWVDEVVRAAAAVSPDAVELHLGDGDHILPDLGRMGGAPRLMLMIGPGQKLVEVLAAGLVPVLAVLDDPIDSIRFTMLTKPCDLLQALREQTRRVSAHRLLRDSPAVALLHRGFEGTARDAVRLVLDRLRLDLPSSREAALLDRFGGGADRPWGLEWTLEQHVPHYASSRVIGTALTADEAAMVRQVLEPMLLEAVQADNDPIVWPSKVFLSGDRPNEAAFDVAEVTGTARTLYYGPYFHLPAGVWQVRVILAFSRDLRRMPFLLLVLCHSRPLARIAIRAREGGAYEAQFTLRHDEPLQSVEINFRNEEATIEGQVALVQMSFTRAGGDQRPA